MSTANRLVLITGAFILALMAIDGLLQLNRAAMADFGYGTSHWVHADSAAALFLVGLVAGVVLGIGIFFAHLIWREKKCAQETDELEQLLAEIEREEAESGRSNRDPLRVEDSPAEDRPESLDPWERSADWWKKTEDD